MPENGDCRAVCNHLVSRGAFTAARSAASTCLVSSAAGAALPWAQHVIAEQANHVFEEVPYQGNANSVRYPAIPMSNSEIVISYNLSRLNCLYTLNLYHFDTVD
jgi:hypothetical protein